MAKATKVSNAITAAMRNVRIARSGLSAASEIANQWHPR